MDDATREAWLEERWLPVVGYEGLYEISDLGRVRSVARSVISGRRTVRVRPRILKTAALPRSGHLHVGLHTDGHQERKYVHRMVAEAFLGPCPDGMEVRHLDGDPRNNRLGNLTYGTHAENMADMVRHGRSFYGRRTHCDYGHEFTSDNTVVRTDKENAGRRCRKCANAQRRARRAQRRRDLH